jgi:DNA-binding NtrC family response regulator
MIVEDERITAEDLRDILTHVGNQVTGVAASGAGNVRELRNTIERAMVLEESAWVQPASRGNLHREFSTAAAVEQAPRGSAPAAGLSLEEVERNMLAGALEKTGWNQTRAARLSSITRDTLRYKMKKFNLRQAAGMFATAQET